MLRSVRCSSSRATRAPRSTTVLSWLIASSTTATTRTRSSSRSRSVSTPKRSPRRCSTGNGIDGGVVVEIGSGKGEFLSLLARNGRNRAIGFDPSYRGESDDTLDESPGRDRAGVLRRALGPADIDLVCLRHVLEHIGEPVAFLARIHAAMIASRHAVLYVEVPNATFTLTESGCWDLIYQHCTYFSSTSLTLRAGSRGIRGPIAGAGVRRPVPERRSRDLGLHVLALRGRGDRRRRRPGPAGAGHHDADHRPLARVLRGTGIEGRRAVGCRRQGRHVPQRRCATTRSSSQST